jgi:anthranilate/para-aminobenzoate synthase component II
MKGNKLISEITLLQQEVRRLARLLTSYILRPGPGRPRHPKITLAAKMDAQGRPWTEIFVVCLPDRALYDSSESYRSAKLGLKKAVRQREKRTQTDGTPSGSPSIQATNSTKFV